MEDYLWCCSPSAQLCSLETAQYNEYPGYSLLYIEYVSHPVKGQLVNYTNIWQVVLIIFADGLIKKDAPGSIHEPARTTLFPENWATLPLSFGLIMCKRQTATKKKRKDCRANQCCQRHGVAIRSFQIYIET